MFRCDACCHRALYTSPPAGKCGVADLQGIYYRPRLQPGILRLEFAAVQACHLYLPLIDCRTGHLRHCRQVRTRPSARPLFSSSWQCGACRGCPQHSSRRRTAQSDTQSATSPRSLLWTFDHSRRPASAAAHDQLSPTAAAHLPHTQEALLPTLSWMPCRPEHEQHEVTAPCGCTLRGGGVGAGARAGPPAVARPQPAGKLARARRVRGRRGWKRSPQPQAAAGRKASVPKPPPSPLQHALPPNRLLD